MRRQGQYADSGINQMVAAQMQHMTVQRIQQNSGMSHFSGQGDSLRTDEERQYMSSKAEEQWQWDREMPKGSDIYKEGQGSDASHSLFQGQRSDPKVGSERQINRDLRAHAHQDGMEVGFEDNALPQTFESLQKKFLQDIIKLTKEQEEAEDTENARHRERLSEVNAQYQDKLIALRARQATHRDEFLRRESMTRQQQYQQANVHSYQNSAGPSDAHAYASAAASAGTLSDTHRAYATGHFDSYGVRPNVGARGHGFDSRGPYLGAQAYNSGGRYF